MMELEPDGEGTRVMVRWSAQVVGASEARALGHAVNALPSSVREMIVFFDEGERLDPDALPTFARIWRAFVRRELRTVFVSPRATVRDACRRVLAEAGDERSTVTVTREIADEWLETVRDGDGTRAESDTVSQLEAVQTRMKSLRDTMG